MAGKSASIVVNILGDASGLAKSLGASSTALSGFGKKALGIGTAMTAGLTLPIVGAGVAAFKAADDFDKAYDTIRVGTGATGKQLEGLKDSFKNVVKDVPASFEDASAAVADLNTRLGIQGPELEGLAKQTLELSRITGEDLNGVIEGSTRVFGDWGISQDDMSGSLDRLFTTSQATGISVGKLSTQLVAYGAPLRQMGFDFETSAALLGKFEKEGVNAELVMGSMRQALGKMAREGEPAVETFKRVTEEIKNAGSTSEANSKALELFGARAGPDMAAALREGRFEVDELLGTLAGSDETILGAAEDTKSFGEKWTEFKNGVLVSLEPLLMKLFDAVGAFADAILPKLQGVVDWFMGLSGETKKWIAIAAGVLAVAGPVVAIFGVLATVLGAIFSPIGLVVAAIAGLVFAFQHFYRTNEGFKEWVNDLVTTIKEKLLVAFNWIKDTALPALADAWTWVSENIIPKLKDAFDWFVDNIWPKITSFLGFIVDEVVPAIVDGFGMLVEGTQQAAEWIRTAWDWIWDKVSAFLNWWMENVYPVLNDVIELVVVAFQRLQSIVSAVWGFISPIISVAIEVITGVINTFITWITPVWNGVWQVVSGVVSAVWNTIKGIVEGALKVIQGIIGVVTGIISGDWGKVWEGIKSVFTGIWDAITSVVTGAINGISSVIGGVMSTISGVWSNAWNGIKGVVGGIWDWISTKISGTMRWVSGIVRGAVDGIKGAFNGLKSALTTALSGIASAVSAPFRAVGNAIKRAWNSTIGGKGFTIPDFPGIPKRGQRVEIPRLHSGGYAGGLAPSERLTILQAGESVRSRQQEANLQDIIKGLAMTPSASTNLELHFHGPVTEDSVAWVAEQVEEAMRRGSSMPRLESRLAS